MHVAYLKGRDNYLCLHRFREFDQAPTLDSLSDAGPYREVVSWARETERGDRGELAHLPEGTDLPVIERVFHAGDGTFIEFAAQWFELRASGTDAVLRFYMEGRDRSSVAELNAAFAGMEIPLG